MSVAIERRVAAPHPGPIVKAEYLDPLGVTPADLAARIGSDPERLGRILAGDASFDVPTAIRIARALQLPAERLMQMQLKFDFAAARQDATLKSIRVLEPSANAVFPNEFMNGSLGLAGGNVAGDGSVYFKQSLERRPPGDEYAGMHALWRGDLLRVYRPGTSEVLWMGPVMQNLDGRVLLPHINAFEWREWFAASYRADLAFGPDHLDFFQRMHAS